jgi:MFS family permease
LCPHTSSSALTPRRELWLWLTLAVVPFTHILDFMILMPLGPQLTALFGISRCAVRHAGVDLYLVGRLLGPAGVHLHDRFGRKRLLLTLYILFGLATLACGSAPTSATLMFAFVSGRMIPGMAIVTSCAQPALRGTFMTLNSVVQSASMGVASLVDGMLISRDAQGMVQNYWMAAVVGITASWLSIVVAGRLKMHGAAAAPAKA